MDRLWPVATSQCWILELWQHHSNLLWSVLFHRKYPIWLWPTDQITTVFLLIFNLLGGKIKLLLRLLDCSIAKTLQYWPVIEFSIIWAKKILVIPQTVSIVSCQKKSKSVQRRFWNDSEDIRKGKVPVFSFYHHGLCSLSSVSTDASLKAAKRIARPLSKLAQGDMTTSMWCLFIVDKVLDFNRTSDCCPWMLQIDAVFWTNWRNWKDFSLKVGWSSSLPFGI